MINAKEEFVSDVLTRGTIECAELEFGDKTLVLKCNYTPEELELFLNQLDFSYDEDYGGQYLDGTVWMVDDGAWFTRGEYDGSEWWEFNIRPAIPSFV